MTGSPPATSRNQPRNAKKPGAPPPGFPTASALTKDFYDDHTVRTAYRAA